MDQKFLHADQLGIRLEMVAGLPIWEPQPVYRHQKAVDRIRTSIRPVEDTSAKVGYECVHIADVYVAFPDGGWVAEAPGYRDILPGTG